jgi:hypothetical protein
MGVAIGQVEIECIGWRHERHKCPLCLDLKPDPGVVLGIRLPGNNSDILPLLSNLNPPPSRVLLGSDSDENPTVSLVYPKWEDAQRCLRHLHASGLLSLKRDLNQSLSIAVGVATRAYGAKNLVGFDLPEKLKSRVLARALKET